MIFNIKTKEHEETPQAFISCGVSFFWRRSRDLNLSYAIFFNISEDFSILIIPDYQGLVLIRNKT